jgi:hypothetical protein
MFLLTKKGQLGQEHKMQMLKTKGWESIQYTKLQKIPFMFYGCKIWYLTPLGENILTYLED